METMTAGSRTRRWLWVAAIWFAFGLFDAAQTVVAMRAEGMHHAWSRLFLRIVLSYLPWALATPAVLRLSRRYPPAQLRPVSGWFAHVTACIAIGVVYSAWTAWWDEMLNPWAYPSLPHFPRLWFFLFYQGMLSFLLVYGAILAVSYVLDSRQRLALHQTETARLNEQLSKAQLSALRRQIEPHFLFNSLNSVAGLVREGRNDDAVSMIAGLSDFLRRVLEDANRQLVPLGEEVEYVQRYLDIQKVRFGEKLQCKLEVCEDLFSAQVPSLILQPMVENAVKHGIAKRTRGGEIRISADRHDGLLTLRVYNDGPGLPEGWGTSPGVGMANVRTRLQGLYGNAFVLDLQNHDHGVEATLSVPLRKDHTDAPG
jgi:signal transduction histidine kinase